MKHIYLYAYILVGITSAIAIGIYSYYVITYIPDSDCYKQNEITKCN
jgi:hypothetical protein